MKLSTKKWILSSGLIGSLSIASASSLLIIKQKGELKDFEKNIQKIAKLSKTYNFEHPELYKHTLTLAKEILRITLNSATGFADVSKTNISNNFKTPFNVPINSINTFFAAINNNQEFNNALNELIKSNFYSNFGYEIKLDPTISTKNKLKEWLINYNKDYILKISNTNLLNPVKIAKQFNSKKLVDFYLFDSSSNKYISVDDYINKEMESKSLDQIKNFIRTNIHIKIKYKLPKDLLIKANFKVKTNELTFGSIPNTTTLNADYDPGNSIKTTSSLWDLTIFKSKHANSFKYAPYVPIFYDYKKYNGIYLSDYAEEFNAWLNINLENKVPIIEKQNLFERFESGRPLSGHNSHFNILQYDKNNDYFYDWNKSTIPLNQAIYNDKLHNSQSSEFGSIPTYGHDFGLYDSSQNIINLDFNKYKYSADPYNVNILNWQYIRRLITWGRSGRVYSMPKRNVTDLAHKNGTLSLGTIFVNSWSDLNFLLYRHNNKYPYVDNLIQMAKDYGFDGWFFNWEPVTMILDHSYNKEILKFSEYLRRRSYEENIQIDGYSNIGQSNRKWENYQKVSTTGMPNDNGLYYFNFNDRGELLSDKVHIPKSGSMHIYLPHLRRPSLTWDTAKIFTQPSIDYFRELYEKYYTSGYKPVTFQMYYTNRALSVDNWMNWIYDMQQKANKKNINSPINSSEWWGDMEHFAYFGDFASDPNWPIGPARGFHSEWNHEKDWGVGKFGDPRTYKNENSSAYSKYFQESSVIDGSKSFSTNFNLGNTDYFFINGNKQNFKLMQAQGLQDILPTYRFINDLYDEDGTLVDWASSDYTKNTIKGIFNKSDAYFGGNSIKYIGNLNGNQKMVSRLFSSKINLSETKNFEITYKGNIRPKLVTWSNWNTKNEYNPAAITSLENGWKKATFKPTNNYVAKYFGISLENTSTNTLSLDDNFLLGGISWNKVNETNTIPFENTNNEYAHEYYNYLNKKVSINLNMGVPNTSSDITYVVKALYEDQGRTKEKIIDVTKHNMTRIDKVDFAYQNLTNGMPYVKFSVDAYNSNGKKIGNHRYWVQLHHDHEILPIDDDGGDKTSPLGIVENPEAVPVVDDDYFTKHEININEVKLSYIDNDGYVKEGQISAYDRLDDKQKIFLKFLAKKLIENGYKTGFVGLIELMILSEKSNTFNMTLLNEYFKIFINYNPTYDESRKEYKFTLVKEETILTKNEYDYWYQQFKTKTNSHKSHSTFQLELF